MLTLNNSVQFCPNVKMVRNYVKKGTYERGSHMFSLTINGLDTDRITIGEWFLHDDLCKAVVVAEEAYHPPTNPITGEVDDVDAGVHQHCFLETKEPYKLNDLREIVLLLTDDIGFDLQVCKSRKSWLLYITKEDERAFIHNVRVSELSLWYRSNHHIKSKYKRPGKVDTADHFIFSVGNHKRVVIDLAENRMNELRRKAEDERVTKEPNMACWLTRAIYNAFLDKQHLYLLGLPGLGKSALVDRLLHKNKVFRAGAPDRFMFAELDESYDYVLFDDFQPMEYNSLLPRIQSFMDGYPTTVSIKGKSDQTRLIKAQFIFVSNEPIPSMMSSLERRVRFFAVDHKMYECVSCL